ncbi:hypothetical protein MMC07_003217 [Pseudocyphellaria aurata]|nr:hypothetical protein [Pseudocyphellaria aurata]
MSYRPSTRRSRSPLEKTRASISKSHRSRSPRGSHHHSSTQRRAGASRPVTLPLEASTLSKHDFDIYKPMFGLYLDIQKQLVLEELSDDEVRGRWKSFVGKWNRGELAEGWYDPITLRKAQASAAFTAQTTRRSEPSGEDHQDDGGVSSDDDAVGPALPGDYSASRDGRRSGPAIPNLQDLELQREQADEDSLSRRDRLREDRRLDRQEQKERLDELAPRAEPGSKDRLLEKKREKADHHRAFAAAKTDAGGVEDVPEADLFGGDDDGGGIEGFKRQKRELDRKKNEREIRREEILRARQAEREQRVLEYKAKEEKTMSGLVALARARYG